MCASTVKPGRVSNAYGAAAPLFTARRALPWELYCLLLLLERIESSESASHCIFNVFLAYYLKKPSLNQLVNMPKIQSITCSHVRRRPIRGLRRAARFALLWNMISCCVMIWIWDQKYHVSVAELPCKADLSCSKVFDVARSASSSQLSLSLSCSSPGCAAEAEASTEKAVAALSSRAVAETAKLTVP